MNQDYNEQNQQPNEEPQVSFEETSKGHLKTIKRINRQKNFAFVLVLVAAILLSAICTFALTQNAMRERYSESLVSESETQASLQKEIDRLTEELNRANETNTQFSRLEALHKIYQAASYYAGDVPLDDIMTVVMKAYAKATGDKYAEYFTNEEFAELTQDSIGDFEGIGVSVLNDLLIVEGVEYEVYYVVAIYENSHAWDAGLAIGDYIYAVKDGEEYRSIEALGGYTKAIFKIRGEKGTNSELLVFRKSGNTYKSVALTILRDAFVKRSVDYKVSETNSQIGIVRISEFDLTTPGQFKEAITELQKKGVEKFVFDLRNNPGGDLRSISATLSYFLQPGDMILKSIYRDGTVDDVYVVEPMQDHTAGSTCNVTAEEIGIFKDLSIVVLCNENTASAAEVFVASMQDYKLATVVGMVTYGKGIMQTYYPLAYFGADGYAKMTSHAYVTKRGVTYHEIGITPDVVVELSDEAAGYSLYTRPESIDNQLQTAIAQFKK